MKYKINGLPVILFLILSLAGCEKFEVTVPEEPIQVELGTDITSVDSYLDYISVSDESMLEDIQINSDEVNTQEVGDYSLTITYKDEEASIPIKVVDTVRPTATIKKDLSFANGTEIKAADLLENIIELADYTVTFEATEGDKESMVFTEDGEITATVKIEDSSGNKSTYPVGFTIYTPDLEAPAIDGVADLTTTVGTELDLLENIKATDNVDGDLTANLKVEGEVDYDTAGTYDITYIALDSAGNISTVPATVTVSEKAKKASKTETTKSTTQTEKASEEAAAGSTAQSSTQTATTGSTASAGTPAATSTTPAADSSGGSTTANTSTETTQEQAATDSGTTPSTDTSNGLVQYDINNYTRTQETIDMQNQFAEDLANGNLDYSKQIQYTP